MSIIKFTVSKECEFDYGHRVPNHGSKCKHVHGHRGKVVVTVEGPLVVEGERLVNEGMVLDFSAIKTVLMEEIHDILDHHFIASKDDPITEMLVPTGVTTRNSFGTTFTAQYFGVVQLIPCVPTAENLAYLCFNILAGRLNTDRVRVVSVEFHETPTSVAKVTA